jgi:hypothetical protein
MGAFGLNPMGETMLALIVFGLIALGLTYINRVWVPRIRSRIRR